MNNTSKDNFFIPKDQNGNIVLLTPSGLAKATTVDTSISSATDVTLNLKTSVIEVHAINGGVYLKYATAVSSSDFDEFISEGQTRHYIIPSSVTLISVIERDSGAETVIIEK